MIALLLTCERATGLLTEFLDGGLALPRRLQVRAHLAICPACRAFLDSLRQVPSRLKRLLPSEPPPRSSLEGSLRNAMARIATGEDPCLRHPDPGLFSRPHLAPLLAAHLARCPSCRAAHPGLAPAPPGPGDPLGPILRAQLPPEPHWKWHRLGLGGPRYTKLQEDAHGALFLLHLPAGRRFPLHDHRGLECAALLQGALDDAGERLSEGSLRIYAPGERHAPLATEEGCWALVHLEGSLAFRGWRRLFA